MKLFLPLLLACTRQPNLTTPSIRSLARFAHTHHHKPSSKDHVELRRNALLKQQEDLKIQFKVQLSSLEKWFYEELDNLDELKLKYLDDQNASIHKQIPTIEYNIKNKYKLDKERLIENYNKESEEIAQKLEHLQFMFGPHRPEYH